MSEFDHFSDEFTVFRDASDDGEYYGIGYEVHVSAEPVKSERHSMYDVQRQDVAAKLYSGGTTSHAVAGWENNPFGQ